MVRQLQDSCTGAAVYAAMALTNMASQEELRKSILAHEAMPALVELLHSTDNNILISAVQAVASLTCDAEARQEVTSSALHKRVHFKGLHNHHSLSAN